MGALQGLAAIRRSPAVCGLLLGTVTTASATAVRVTIDGAASEVAAVVPANLAGYLLGGSSAALTARVIGTRIGSQFYILEVIASPIGALGAGLRLYATTATIVQTSPATTGTGTATFPAGMFAVAPSVQVTDTSANVDHVFSVTAVTPTTATIVMRHEDNTTASASHVVNVWALG